MSTETVFETTFDAAMNRLTVRFSGYVDASKMEECYKQIESHLPSLRPKFSMLTDLSGLELMDIACIPYLEKIMNLCREKDISTVVRVVPNPAKDIGFNILSKFHYPRSIRVITCETLIEAHRVLG